MKLIRYKILLGFLFVQTLQAQISLESALMIALGNNPDISIAVNEAQQAGNSNIPGNAGKMPSVSLNMGGSPSLTDINQKFANGTEIARNNVLNNNYNASVVFSYTLYDGRKMYATSRKLESMDRAATLALQIRMQEIVAEVIMNYCNIVRGRSYLNDLSRLRELSVKRLELTELRLKSGLSDNTDLFLARLDLDARQQAVLSQEAGIFNAYAKLNVLLNIKADSIYTVDSTIEQRPLLKRSELDSMLNNNPEWKLAEEQVRIASATKNEIASARLPLIRLNGAYNYNLSQSQAGFSLYNRNNGPMAGITLSVPLFTGGVNKANLENAKLQEMNTELRKRQTERNLYALYVQAWQDYNTAQLQLESDRQSIKTAESLIRLMQERFNAGRSTILEFIEAQRTYEETKYRYQSNLYISKLAETQILMLTGQLLKKDR